MANLLDHLWRQVFRSSTISLSARLRIKHLSKSKINDFKVAIHVNKDVFQLQISVDNSLFVQVTQSHCDLSSVKLNFVFLESALCFEESVQLSSSDKRHDEKEAVLTHE